VLAVARREVTETEVDAMFAVLGNAVYLLLTETSGWSDHQYASWVAATAARLLDLAAQGVVDDAHQRYRRAAYRRWREARPMVDKIPQHRLPA
jgi:hypothetical protein